MMKREEVINKLLTLLDEVSNNRELLPEIKKLLYELGESKTANEIEEILSGKEKARKIDEIKAKLSEAVKAENLADSLEPGGELAEEFVTEFFEEAKIHLEETERLLLEIEQHFSVEKLKEIMRHFHTIKGDSSLVMNMVAMGDRRNHISLINKLAHTLEELFQHAQHDNPSYIPTKLDSILQILESLKTALDNTGKLSILKKLCERAQKLSKSSDNIPDRPFEANEAFQNILNQFLELAEDTSINPNQLKRLVVNVKKGLKKAGKNELCELVDEVMDLREKKEHPKLKNAIQKLKRPFEKTEGFIAIPEKLETKSETSVHEKYVRVERDKLDTVLNEVSELSNLVLSLEQSEELETQRKLVRNLKKLSSEMSRMVISIRTVKADELFNRFRLTVRNFAQKQGKRVLLHVEKTNVEIDRDIADNLAPLLTHLLRNAIDHGIKTPQERKKCGKPEEGHIFLRAEYRGGFIFIDVEDDGEGISVETVKEKLVEKKLVAPENLKKFSTQEILNYLFLPGFSTADRISEISGRGVGLDAVKRGVEDMGGRVLLNSKSGEGTTITLAIPLTLSLVNCILFEVSNQKYAIKSDEILRTLSFAPSELVDYGDYSLLKLGDKSIPSIYLSELFGTGKDDSVQKSERSSFWAFVISDRNGDEMALIIDEIISEGEFLIKHLPGLLKGLFSGAISLGRNGLALFIDLNTLINML